MSGLAWAQETGAQRKITLGWDASPSPQVQGYRLYRFEPNTEPQMLWQGEDTQATVELLTRAHRFFVVAYDERSAPNSESVPSNILAIPQAPDAPSNLRANRVSVDVRVEISSQ